MVSIETTDPSHEFYWGGRSLDIELAKEDEEEVNRVMALIFNAEVCRVSDNSTADMTTFRVDRTRRR